MVVQTIVNSHCCVLIQPAPSTLSPRSHNLFDQTLLKIMLRLASAELPVDNLIQKGHKIKSQKWSYSLKCAKTQGAWRLSR